MRILSVTQSYAPFYEFGGPPVKVEALANGLTERGHAVTVLTADWGFGSRVASGKHLGDARLRGQGCAKNSTAIGWLMPRLPVGLCGKHKRRGGLLLVLDSSASFVESSGKS